MRMSRLTADMTKRGTAMLRQTALPFAMIALLGGAAALPAQDHAHHGHGMPMATSPAAGVAPAAESLPSRPLSGRILEGAPVAFGNGTARTLVAIGADGKPTTVALSLSADALDGLQADAPADDLGWLYRLALPAGVALPPYDHIGLYWNPHGHEPHGVYDVGHLDVHFMMSPPEELDRITAMDRDLELVYRLPPAAAIPAGYLLPPGTQHRRMGVHWVDTGAAELHGGAFTATFIVGSYNQQVNFLEPMLTRAFLATKPDLTRRCRSRWRSHAPAGIRPPGRCAGTSSVTSTSSCSTACAGAMPRCRCPPRWSPRRA